MSSLFACRPRLAVPLAAWVIGLSRLGLGRLGPAIWIVSRIDVVIIYYYYLVELARCGTIYIYIYIYNVSILQKINVANKINNKGYKNVKDRDGRKTTNECSINIVGKLARDKQKDERKTN